MVLDRHRRVLDWWLVPVAKAFRGIHPDVFTWMSLVFAVLAGILFWQSPTGTAGIPFLLGAFVCIGLNSIFDLLDGKIANLTGKASPRGDYLDHALDRFSDVAILGGLTASAWVHMSYGVAALAATLLTSYLGTQAQAVGLKRNYGGFLGRADRMVLLLAAPLAQTGIEFWGIAQPYQPWAASALDVVVIYFAMAGAVTVVQRFVSTLKAFGKDGQLP